MRSPATPPRHKLASALAVAILALVLLPMLGGQPAAIAEEARGGAPPQGPAPRTSPQQNSKRGPLRINVTHGFFGKLAFFPEKSKN